VAGDVFDRNVAGNGNCLANESKQLHRQRYVEFSRDGGNGSEAAAMTGSGRPRHGSTLFSLRPFGEWRRLKCDLEILKIDDSDRKSEGYLRDIYSHSGEVSHKTRALFLSIFKSGSCERQQMTQLFNCISNKN